MRRNFIFGVTRTNFIFIAYLAALLAEIPWSGAIAQNAGEMINLFGTMMRAAMIDHARTEWSKVPLNETSCIEQGLRQQGNSIATLIQNGVAPTDPSRSRH
jgi:hypothetical protein